jgi:sulfate permease, SulP family
LLTTFALTVAVDLTVAIQAGVVMAAFLFMRRMAEVTNVGVFTREFRDEEEDPYIGDANATRWRDVPDGVRVYEINGPFFFGAAETFKERVSAVEGRPAVLIIRMRNVPAIDSTGLHALSDLVRRSHRDGVHVLLSDVHAQPLIAVGRSYLLDELGDENIFGNLDDALNAARAHLGLPPQPPPAGVGPTVAREVQGEQSREPARR